ncbi:MAG: ABC transporter permease subunit [Planctomycetes bacterium]|nr:ABC transporter permease subunit [Planctomycetota bacterium]
MTNPILRKEVLTSLRTRKALGMQVVYLAVLIALVFVNWPDRGLQSIGGNQAQQLLTVLGVGQLLLIAMFAPAFTSTTLTYEKERNTFESLFTTPLRPWELTFGKMAGSLTFLLVLVLMGAPVLASLLLLGGVTGTQILAVLGILVITCLYLGAIGLLVSAVMHRSYRSIIVTYAILLVVCILAPMPAWPISGNMIQRAGPAGSKLIHVIASLSPLQAMLSLVVPDGEFTSGAAGMPAFWQLYLILASLMFVAVTAYLFFKLHRPVAPPRPRERLKVVERGQISARSFFFLFDPAKRKPMIRWWQNPVAIKEFRTRPMLQIQWLLRMASICLMVSIALMGVVTVVVSTRVAEGISLVSKMVAVVAVLQVVLIVLIGPAMSAGSICADRETSVWDLMRASRLRSWTIVVGKLQASIVPLILLVAAMTPALLILTYFAGGLWPYIIRSLGVIGVTTVFVVVLGMFFSSLCSRTSAATAWTYGVVVVLSIVTMIVLLGGSILNASLVRAVFLPNPVAAVLDAAGVPSFQQYNLFVSHIRLMAVVACVLFAITVVRVWHLCRSK